MKFTIWVDPSLDSLSDQYLWVKNKIFKRNNAFHYANYVGTLQHKQTDPTHSRSPETLRWPKNICLNGNTGSDFTVNGFDRRFNIVYSGSYCVICIIRYLSIIVTRPGLVVLDRMHVLLLNIMMEVLCNQRWTTSVKWGERDTVSRSVGQLSIKWQNIHSIIVNS